MKTKIFFRFLLTAALSLLLGWLIFGYPFLVHADAILNIEPITWNVIGLDSNNVNVGPDNFPIGVRACNPITSTTSVNNVSADFVWTSANSYVSLRTGSLDPISPGVSLAPGDCYDFYFEITVSRDANAYDTTRRYRIDVSGEDSVSGSPVSVSSPTPREIYIEHLISQSRNSTTDVKLDGVSVAPGGTMALMLGNSYDIQLVGSTATNGYEQIESYINFPNTIFQINSVSSTYTANGGTDPDAPTKVYADGCNWENDPNSPNYRSCLSTGKYGGDITVTYNVTIIGGAGTSETLNTLIYDFSGSSYHYNSDFSVASRIAAIVDPSLVTIDKNFTPNPISVNGTSTLIFTLTNPNGAMLTDLNFTDTLPSVLGGDPGDMVIASPATYSTSGCGTPTVEAPIGGGSFVAGAPSISVSDATVPANGYCTVSVNVTAPAASPFDYTNTSSNLFIGSVDTGNSASANLTVSDAPLPPACTNGVELVRWEYDGLTFDPTYTHLQVSIPPTGTTYSGTGTSAISTALGNPINSWSVLSGWAADDSGYPNGGAAPYFEFLVDSSNFTDLSIQYDFKIDGNWANSASNFMYTYSNADGGGFAHIDTQTAFDRNDPFSTVGPLNANLTGSSTTAFRINAVGQQQPTAAVYLDNVVITGCGIPEHPTITKVFTPDQVAVGGTSTLTFTIDNPNLSVALSAIAFSDTLPTGLTVATTGPIATCGGTLTTTTPDTISFSGGTLAAGTSCSMAGVTVTATTTGPHTNVSGFITSAETGENSGSDGFATDTLTALSPPEISKQFSPNPILVNGISTLTFTITNPNPDDQLTNVAFSDNFPLNLVNAATPAASSTCGGIVTAAAGLGNITFSGGTIAGGGTCTVQVDVTSAIVDSYANTSGNVSADIVGNGNSAGDTLVVEPVRPSISLLKRISTSATGPWTTFVAVDVGDAIYYQFTVENTGDVPLSPVAVTDPTLAGTTADPAACIWPDPLPVAVAANENHIANCVPVLPILAVSGSHSNIATAQGTYSSVVYNSDPSSAAYATTGLTLVKSVAESYFLVAGEVLNYSYEVTNSGSAPLAGPAAVSDDKATDESCPAVDTVGDFDAFFDPVESITCTATYIVTVGDVTAGSVTNTASATVDSVTSNTDSETVALAIPAIQVVKEVSVNSGSNWDDANSAPGPFLDSGTDPQFRFTVTNTGNVNLSSLTLSDTDVGSFFESDLSTVCTIPGTLAPSASFTCYGTLSWASGQHTNTATTSGMLGTSTYSDTDDAYYFGLAAATISKSFSPASIAEGGTSLLTITLSNSNTVALTGASLTDTYPAGVVNAPTPNPGTTCAGGTASTPSADSIALSGGTIPASGSCTIMVTVTSSSVGGYVNNIAIGDLSTDQGVSNSVPATATLTVTDILPDISVTKTANPLSVPETGGSVTFTFVVTNNAAEQATLTALNDSDFGDLDGQGTCVVPQTLAASGGTYSCAITQTISGDFGGADHSNTVTATATDDDGNSDTANATATVTFTDVLPDISVTKTANPLSVPETGGGVTFTFVVTNNTAEQATLTALNDSDFGDLDGQGTCVVPQTLAASGGSYTCAITQTISGDFGGADHSNTVTATATDDNGNTDTNTDSATVTFTDVLPDISVTKTANPLSVPETGGNVTFTVTVTNNGSEQVTLTSLSDDQFGNLNGQGSCSLPQTLAASGGNYSCSFTGAVPGGDASGAGHTDVVTATASDNDGNSDAETDTAIVTYTDVAPSVTVTKSANPVSVTQPSGLVTFTVDVQNTSGEAVTLTSLLDDIYGNLNGQGTCVTGGSIAAGATYSCTFTATVSGSAGDSETDTVTAVVTDNEGSTGTDSDSATVTVTALAPPTISKSFSPDPIAINGVSTLTLTITNPNGAALTGAALTDTYPGEIFNETPANGATTCAGGVVTAADGGGSVSLSGGTVPANGSCTVTVDVTSATPGTHTNSTGGVTTNEAPPSGTASDTLTVIGSSSATIDKTFVDTNQPHTVGDEVAIGEILTYEVDVTLSPGVMNGAELIDYLDRGLAFVNCESISAPPTLTTSIAGGFTWICNNPQVSAFPSASTAPVDQGRSVSFDSGNLTNSSGGNVTLTIRYRVAVLDSAGNARGGQLDNLAIWQWTSAAISDSSNQVVIVEPDLSLQKTASPTVVTPGTIVTYTHTVAHTASSDAAAFDLELADDLPTPLVYEAGTLDCSPGTQDPDTCSFNSGLNELLAEWTAASGFTAAGGMGRVQLDTRLGNASPGSSFTNIATLQWSSLPGDVSTPQSIHNTLSTERYYDPPDPVDIYGVQASAIIRTPGSPTEWLPATGFAPGIISQVSSQPQGYIYKKYGELDIEIPSISLRRSIIGIPFGEDSWQLDWLWDQTGYLEGTAFPTWSGNTVITAHVYLPNGLPGPFARLGELRWGDQVLLHAFGRQYIYEVREVRSVLPNDPTALKHEELDWVTLITCANYDSLTDSYRQRLIVRAVLMRIE